MNRDEFNALVRKIESRHAARPRGLALKMAALVLLGYLGFLSGWLFVLAVAALFFVGAVTAQSGLGLAVLALAAGALAMAGAQVALLLWPPEESTPLRRLRPSDSPQLFAKLRELRAASGAARLHRVELTAEFNAGIVQAPRLGVFGFSRNELHLGLPLLDVLSWPELEAVLAHEMGHLSRKHGRFGTWVYRLRQTWDRLFQGMLQRRPTIWSRIPQALLSKFVAWYWPRFNAHAFVLSRQQEYSADRFAGERAGAECSVSALWRIGCLSRRLNEEVWIGIHQLANEQPEPISDLTARVLSHLRAPADSASQQRWMSQTLDKLTDYHDTHPSFSDRAAALGADVEAFRRLPFPSVATPPVAEALFEGRLAELRRDVDQNWRRQIEETWRTRHGRAASRQRQLAALPENAAPDVEQLWEKAWAVVDLDGPEKAAPLLRQVLELRPSHRLASLILGQHLLERGGAEGEAHLQRVLEKHDEDDLALAACESLAQYYQSSGQADRLRETHARLSSLESVRDKAQAERNLVAASDRFLPHGLPPERLSQLRRLLRDTPHLEAASLVRKALRFESRQPLFVLCVRSRRGIFGSRSDVDQQIVSALIPRVALPGRVLIIGPHGPFRRLARVIFRRAGADVLTGLDAVTDLNA